MENNVKIKKKNQTLQTKYQQQTDELYEINEKGGKEEEDEEGRKKRIKK